MEIVSKKNLVEFVGTYIFLLVIIVTGNPWAIGATLAAIIYLWGHISGGNFNPAVTIMMTLAKKQPSSELVPFILAQVLGGCLANETFKTLQANKIL